MFVLYSLSSRDGSAWIGVCCVSSSVNCSLLGSFKAAASAPEHAEMAGLVKDATLAREMGSLSSPKEE